MLNAERAIVDEIESAIKIGSTEKQIETVRRVTDLFLVSAGNYDDEQIELFDTVLERLIKTIEIRAIADVNARIALVETSVQLASVTQAPSGVIRRLARNDEIMVAGPVLSESARLSNEDLVELAQTKAETHLLAIAGRWSLKEVVTDALLTRNLPNVSHRVVKNPGARISADGFGIVVAQSKSDPELAVETGIRVDLPAQLRNRLLKEATEAVRKRLLTRAPAHLFEEIRAAITEVTADVGREMAKPRDFTAARRFIALLKEKGQLNETTLCGFAKARKYEETVVALAALSKSSIDVIRPLMQSLRDDGLLVPCKVAQLKWETVIAVLESRYSTGAMSAQELAKAREKFVKLTDDNALRMLKFWQVRATPQGSSLN